MTLGALEKDTHIAELTAASRIIWRGSSTKMDLYAGVFMRAGLDCHRGFREVILELASCFGSCGQRDGYNYGIIPALRRYEYGSHKIHSGSTSGLPSGTSFMEDSIQEPHDSEPHLFTCRRRWQFQRQMHPFQISIRECLSGFSRPGLYIINYL